MTNSTPAYLAGRNAYLGGAKLHDMPVQEFARGFREAEGEAARREARVRIDSDEIRRQWDRVCRLWNRRVPHRTNLAERLALSIAAQLEAHGVTEADIDRSYAMREVATPESPLPCPFCGGVCEAEGRAYGWVGFPVCTSCGATAPSIEVWNRRVG